MIIWLASYPKSGNTMLRSMITAYLFDKKGKFNFDLLPNIKQFPNTPVLENLGVNIDDHNEIIKNSIRAQESFNKKESVGFVKTHNMLYNFNKKYPFTNLDNTLGVIYIVRDPRNVVLSYARHLKVSIEETVKFITKGKANDMFFMGNWSENYLSWKGFKQYNKYLLIKYEDLISNREETFSKILKFIFSLRKINLSIDHNKLNNVLSTTSFEYLKKLEKEKGFRESMKDKDGNNIPFFDKGKSRDWANSLDKDMTAEIEKTFNKEMIELGYL
jgi:hypothetical protein